jgi:para-nitrobenzyl esterase
MNRGFGVLLLLVMLGITVTEFSVNSQPIRIKTENGLIAGKKSGDVNIFLGIPYAAPPVGNLRWRAPQPPVNWQGVKDCTKFSASPMQWTPKPFMMWTEEFIAPPEPLSEDCLYLNIWTKSIKPEAKLPVFVWIYGGGFSSGSSACAVYDGEEYAKRSVVFVSINYRVGVFGFLAHPDLTKESENKSSGNYGILDQIEALKWLKNNVSAFGGDPENITIAGQSAGSMAVNILIASPQAKGLFQRAIAESGGIFSSRFMNKLSDAEKTGIALAKKFSVAGIAELRKIPAEKIQSDAAGEGIGRFGPVQDGYVLPKDLKELFKDNSINNVPIITGWVTGDASLSGSGKTSKEEYEKQAKAKYGASAGEFLTLFPGNTEEEIQQSQARLGLISFAGLPSHMLAGLNKKQSYIYQYSHVPPDKPGFPNYGAFHTSEVPYALHTLHLWKREWKPLDLKLEGDMSAYWINFARTGNPNGPGLPVWKPYEKANGNILEIGDRIELRPGMMKKEFDFLENELMKK